MGPVQHKLRQTLSRLPLVYGLGVAAKLVWLRLTYSGGDVLSAILLVKSEHGLALDVGANRGQSAIKIAKLKPGFKIISFEPNRRCRHFLDIVKLMLRDSFSYQLAGLSDTCTEMTYYEPFLKTLPVPAEGTFCPDNLDGELEDRLGRDFTVRKATFPVFKLDDLNLSPQFMKIDVQGLELNVLLGALNTIQRCKPVLVVERNRHNESEVTAYLAGLGYQKLDKTAVQSTGAAPEETHDDNVFTYAA